MVRMIENACIATGLRKAKTGVDICDYGDKMGMQGLRGGDWGRAECSVRGKVIELGGYECS